MDCETNVTQVKAIVDCGSPICILNYSVFREMGIAVDLDEVQTKIVGAEGRFYRIGLSKGPGVSP